jgi:hypothetical protein
LVDRHPGFAAGTGDLAAFRQWPIAGTAMMFIGPCKYLANRKPWRRQPIADVATLRQQGGE